MTNSEQTKSGKIARNTLFLYGQMFVQMIVALLTARMLFNALGVVDYGIYNVIGGVVVVFSVLNNVEGATIRFLTYDIGRNCSREEVHLMFSTAQTVHMVIALMVLLLAETAGLYYVFHELVIPPERFQSTLVVYQFSIVTAMLSIISIPYSALLIAHEKMGAFASFGILQTFVGVGIVLIVKYTNTDKLILYGALMMLMQVSVRIAYGLYCRKHFEEVAGKWCFDKKLFIRMLKFAGWTFNGTVAYMAYTEGVNLLLNAFFGPVMNAARGIANTIRMKVESFASNPQIVKSYAQQDLPYLHKLIITSSRFSLLMIFMLSLPVVLETDTILRLWLGKVPEYTVAFTRLALFSVMVETIGRILIMAIQATGKIAKFQMIEANILLLIVPVSYVCLKAGCSPVAVYLTQLFVFIIAHAARIMIVCPAIGMGVAALPPTLLFYLTQDTTHEYWRLAAIVCMSLLSSGVSIFYIGCDASMRAFIVNKIKTKISHG